MSNNSTSTDREVYGANALMGALIFLSAVLAFALLAGTSPEMAAHAQAAAAHAQAVAAVAPQQVAS